MPVKSTLARISQTKNVPGIGVLINYLKYCNNEFPYIHHDLQDGFSMEIFNALQ